MVLFVEDVDECSAGQHSCGTNSRCQNNNGGYTCQCDEGFELMADQINCQGNARICVHFMRAFEFSTENLFNQI